MQRIDVKSFPPSTADTTLSPSAVVRVRLGEPANGCCSCCSCTPTSELDKTSSAGALWFSLAAGGHSTY